MKPIVPKETKMHELDLDPTILIRPRPCSTLMETHDKALRSSRIVLRRRSHWPCAEMSRVEANRVGFQEWAV